jgi:hypothetical protein
MTRPGDINRLRPLAQVILDQRLARLRDLATCKDRSLAQIAALDQPLAAPGIGGVARDLVALRYQGWADQRRRELNLLLARQTADWVEARDAARLAFGRAEVLRTLGQRGAGKR